MVNNLVKCDRKSCGKDQYQNQLKPIESPEGVIFKLCADCHECVTSTLADKDFVGDMMRGEMTPGEHGQVMREKAEDYAMSDFDLGMVGA